MAYYIGLFLFIDPEAHAWFKLFAALHFASQQQPSLCSMSLVYGIQILGRAHRNWSFPARCSSTVLWHYHDTGNPQTAVSFLHQDTNIWSHMYRWDNIIVRQHNGWINFRKWTWKFRTTLCGGRVRLNLSARRIRHGIVFFSHNKIAAFGLSAAKTIIRTAMNVQKNRGIH